jgi:hypothetical protein
MRITDGLKLKGRPAEIPDCSRDNLPQFFVEMGYKVGAEIGVYRGEFTEKFCKAGLTMYAIDPWIGYKGAGRTERVQEMQDYNYNCAKKTLSPYKNCTLIRKSSMDALNDFRSESLDFVYIDGDHRFPFVAEDIYEWYWKVKRGGIISGHDYFCTDPKANNVISHVKTVVDAFIETLLIPNFYVFGKMNRLEQKSKNDRIPSWMFVKP